MQSKKLESFDKLMEKHTAQQAKHAVIANSAKNTINEAIEQPEEGGIKFFSTDLDQSESMRSNESDSDANSALRQRPEFNNSLEEEKFFFDLEKALEGDLSFQGKSESINSNEESSNSFDKR